MKRLTFGRLQVYIEPRDVWVGAYIASDAVYVLPLPLCVFRWQRAQVEDEWPGPHACLECGLPDIHNGRGDGYGSCDCPRCRDCRNPPGLCDCHWREPDQCDLDDDDWDGHEDQPARSGEVR